LHYTTHSHQDDVRPHLIPYDEAIAYLNRVMKKSIGKRNMIQNSLKVIFHSFALYKLIDDFRALFDLCYLPLLVTSYNNIYCL